MKNLNYLTKSKTILGIIFCLGIVTANAQNISFPDSNFKAALVNHDPVIDTNGNGEISVSEAAAFTGTMNVSGKSISDMTGIAFFYNITELNCSNNSITGNLDLQYNTLLTTVRCNSNQLSALNISGLTALDFLHCSTNNLTSLDVSNNTALKTLWASNNQLTTIDVSNNTALENLSVQNNNLTWILDVTASPNLMYLQCFDNNLTEINAYNLSLTLLEVYNNPSLEILYCYNNDLTTLDLTGLPVLRLLNCKSNQLTSLDVSANLDLEYLYCDSNQLTTLNTANGNNASLSIFYAENNDLDCIQIDSGFTPPTDGTWTKDSETEYSDDCAMGTSDIEAFAFSVYPNPVKDILTIETSKAIEKIEVYGLSGKKLMNLNGQKQVNMSSLAPGTYMVKIMLDGATETQKIIKK